MVGMFVVIGLSLAVVAIIWLGMANYFEEGQLYVAYFDESVQGLDKDSPVKYRGVSIGRVYSIGVAPDSNLIQVVLKIETSIDLDESIVAQLKSVGITGLMFVELEKLEDRSLVLTHPFSFSTKYPIINTKPCICNPPWKRSTRPLKMRKFNRCRAKYRPSSATFSH
ncbi:MAG: MlaD family protein [Deltaproteobacteria bacterium]